MTTLSLTVERDVSLGHQGGAGRRVIVSLLAQYSGLNGMLDGVLPFVTTTSGPTQIRLNLDDPQQMQVMGNLLPDLVLRNIKRQLRSDQSRFKIVVEANVYTQFIANVRRQFGQDVSDHD